jgi:uncharacterized protein YjbI with pentapeptide repeats
MADISDDTELDTEDDELKPWERPFDVRPGGSAAGLDLSGMELGGDLSGIDFRKAIIGGWDPVSDDDMYGPGGTPDLQYTEFEGANLTGANFAGQDLSNCRFEDATLRGADLSGCTLFGTVFDGAELTGANLTGVVGIQDAYMSGATIDDVIGLDEETLEYLQELI